MPRVILAATALLLVLSAGCVGGPGATATSESPTGESPTTTTVPTTDAATPPADGEVAFPDGPKDRPERPSNLTEDSVGEFVRTHEYRYAYNQLWYSEHSEVTLDCEVRSVTARNGWYEAVVSCTGYSNTGGDRPGTETATEVHADWFTQTYVYYVDEDSIVREGVENR
ncbi:hypothetical protein [Halomicrobium salinisoli]|uniref:hypothetical protein n=1 Tax=Halomicrobium salinisoli TaxID=2878391 RepID=UPI001CEFF68B|nr:hypothetical protein [Halomicrobium salinisoli]